MICYDCTVQYMHAVLPIVITVIVSFIDLMKLIPVSIWYCVFVIHVTVQIFTENILYHNDSSPRLVLHPSYWIVQVEDSYESSSTPRIEHIVFKTKKISWSMFVTHDFLFSYNCLPNHQYKNMLIFSIGVSNFENLLCTWTGILNYYNRKIT